MIRVARLTLLATLAALGGCSTIFPDLFPETCEQFEERRKNTNYATDYRYSESDTEASAANFKALPKNEAALARLYKLRFDRDQVRPCSHVTIHKELFLQRREKSPLVLEETREFYAADGTLIARKVEALSSQLRTTGHYHANVPLPIPKSAPAGKYKIVSKLTLKAKGTAQATLLAKASASFQVVPLTKK